MNIKRIALLLFIVTTGFLACKHNDDVYPSVHYAALTVVNTTSDTLNFYLNGTRINNTSILYPQGAIGYIPVVTLGRSSAEDYQFKKPGTTTVLLSYPLALDTGTYNSLFVAGFSSGQAFTTKDLIYTFTAANADTSLVRFVNASPTTGNLDFYINDTLAYSNLPFKSATGFNIVNVGSSSTKVMSVCKTGTTIPLAKDTVTMNLSTQYTFFSQGVIGGTGSNAFSLGSMVNQLISQ